MLSGTCREVVEWSYAVVIRAMFAALERVAATDPKHGIRLRLENYSAFVEGLSAVSFLSCALMAALPLRG